MLTLLLLVLSADDSAKLTLVPNATEILQRDNLLLLSVLENKTISAVHVMGDSEPACGYICHEIQDKGGSWIKIMASIDQIGIFCGMKGNFVLNGQSSTAECEAVHRRSLKGAFHFENPGTYKIRAVAPMPWGELCSEPVTIVVKERSLAHLKEIEETPPSDLWSLGRPGLGHPLRESLLKLKPVGGNIARTIEQWEMAQAVCEGGKWNGATVLKEKNCKWMQENMDPVALENSLDAVSAYYVSKKHWEGLPRFIDAMQYDSLRRRDLIYHLKLLTRPPTPAIP